jgi:hypothetical protein
VNTFFTGLIDTPFKIGMEWKKKNQNHKQTRIAIAVKKTKAGIGLVPGTTCHRGGDGARHSALLGEGGNISSHVNISLPLKMLCLNHARRLILVNSVTQEVEIRGSGLKVRAGKK